ncbi:hypothetical protein P7C70_g2592, partial [Phenoliferia sp. Uapishka_3]
MEDEERNLESATSTIVLDEGEHQISPSKNEKEASQAAAASESASLPEVAEGLTLTPIPDSKFLLLAFSKKPSHPEDPLCFSRRWKIWLTFFAAILVMNTALASSTPSGGAPWIQARFGGNVGGASQRRTSDCGCADELLLALLDAVSTPSFTISLRLCIWPGEFSSPVSSSRQARRLIDVSPQFLGAPLSEAFGRRPVFIWGTLAYTAFSAACIGAPNLGGLLALRFLSGFFGVRDPALQLFKRNRTHFSRIVQSVPTTNSGAVCGDIWNARERGTAMSFYSVATFSGPSLGPIIGSFSASRAGWKYNFIILTAFSALLFVFVIFACPETYPPIIVKKIARELRESTKDDRIISRLEWEEMATRGIPKKERFKAEANRPELSFVNISHRHPSHRAYPVIFDGVHHLGDGYSSLPFLGVLVGAIISVPITLYYQKQYVKAIEKLGHHTPEMRLQAAEVGGICMVIAFLWLGWTGYKSSLPWFLPIIAGIPQGIGSVLVFRSIQTYLIDTYERNAASATAANVITRSIAGGVFPLFGRVMFEKLGVQWAATVLAGCMLLLTPVPFVFRTRGAQLRKMSKFTPGR